MHVHGQYNTSLPEVIFESQKIVNNQELEEIAVKSPKEITITYGYSRDHRPDLKQFIINMSVFMLTLILLYVISLCDSLGCGMWILSAQYHFMVQVTFLHKVESEFSCLFCRKRDSGIVFDHLESHWR
ncbi:hypothetical protein PN471_17720 [Aphanizomenon sp. CS-733/32]|nr:hypothetical protein [Aphanizomenon sp. CS-733/32]MDB9310433.1 hypothetical protein [Aphanizomenon sp. CS-733/32]